ncbi:P-loop containing nucleoside triphosphate hydrolase protein [Ramaria rubella]|nr:P-loop containing nucleoside triphosphate hydrolase protein [Ramaria rubella]KAF8589920.1 P-loop containing nucleoside triphosphate hydrolase protein [Ramaria rubella]
MALFVQLPLAEGGLSGSACYLTTNGVLHTSRLLEIAQHHQLTISHNYTLANIHTRSISSLPELEHILSQGIPTLAQRLSESSSTHPLSLLVLDSIGALFRFDSDRQTTSKILFDRSRKINNIALLLHRLASTYHLAVLVINEVNPTFEPTPASEPAPAPDRILYSEQAKWFSKNDSHPSEGCNEVGLGLVWANHVGVRVVITRTGRRRHLPEAGDDVKRHHYENGQEGTLIRRLSVVFSSVSPPASIDFVILRSGVVSVNEIAYTALYVEPSEK